VNQNLCYASYAYELRIVENVGMDEVYINLGTEKCCLFVKASIFLLKRLERYPLLYYAVEEALVCANRGYYGIGVIALAQLLNFLNEETPIERHEVAHEFLTRQPTKEVFDEIKALFKKTAEERAAAELERVIDKADYRHRVMECWTELMTKHHGSSITQGVPVAS
jgi:hypothetical protein